MKAWMWCRAMLTMLAARARWPWVVRIETRRARRGSEAGGMLRIVLAALPLVRTGARGVEVTVGGRADMALAIVGGVGGIVGVGMEERERVRWRKAGPRWSFRAVDNIGDVDDDEGGKQL